MDDVNYLFPQCQALWESSTVMTSFAPHPTSTQWTLFSGPLYR